MKLRVGEIRLLKIKIFSQDISPKLTVRNITEPRLMEGFVN